MVLRVLVRKVPRVLVPGVLTVLAILLTASSAAASERYALIVTGAHGEPSYTDQYAQWRQAAVTALLEKLAFEDSRITMLFEGGDTAHAATADGGRRSLAA